MPIGIFDVIINGLQFAADLFKSEGLEDAAEFGRIGRYYAIEDMLTTEPGDRRVEGRVPPALSQPTRQEPSQTAVDGLPAAATQRRYGKTTLREHYERIAEEGQEYDPYTSVFGSKESNEALQKK